MYCKYLNLRNNEELAQITMRKRNSTLNESTPNCPKYLELDQVHLACRTHFFGIYDTVCTADSVGTMA